MKIIIEADRPQMKIRRMRMACWIPKAEHALSEYVIFIGFARRQYLDQCASMYTYIVSLSNEF